jgi:hypothetical protein
MMVIMKNHEVNGDLSHAQLYVVYFEDGSYNHILYQQHHEMTFINSFNFPLSSLNFISITTAMQIKSASIKKKKFQFI